MSRCMAVVCALGGYLATSVAVFASVPVLDVRADLRSHGLAPYLEVLEDPSAALTLPDIMARRVDFQPLADPRPNLGMTQSAFWLHAALSGTGHPESRWLIEVAAPVLDDVSVYFTRSGVVIDRQFAGDMRAFTGRPYAHRNPVFPVPDAGADMIDVWLRIASEGTMVVPVTLWREDAYLRQDNGLLLFMGGYFGLLVTLIVYNAFLFLAVRDRSYLFYVSYLGGTALLQFTLAGWSSQYLWPGAAGLSNTMTIVFFAMTTGLGAFFPVHFLDLRRRQRVLGRILSALAFATIPTVAIGIWVSYLHGLRLMMLVTVAVVVVIVVAGIRGFVSGYRPARFVLLAFSALAPGAVLLIMRTVGWVPSNFFTDHAIELGTACEAILLSFGLADRINLLEAEKTAARAEAARAQARFSRDLIENQETDRRRIAGALHDSIGQSLLVLRNTLRRMAGKQGNQADVAELLELSDQVRGTLNETRSLSRLLHPHQLDSLGLVPAIQAMADQAFEATGIACETRLEPVDGRLDRENHIHAFRFIQEAVNNVIKHAKARRCSIFVGNRDGGLEIRVEDDGQGLPENAVDAMTDADGFGLAMLRERVNLMNGTFSIGKGALGGTAVVARLVPMGDVP